MVLLSLLSVGIAFADPRSYGSLSATEQALCDEYATQAERIARGREAGFSVYSPLNAARDACAEHPNDDDVCRVAGLDLASCVAARRKKAAARR